MLYKTKSRGRLGLMIAAGLVVLGASEIASAVPLANGNFEAPTNSDSANNTFPSWGESPSGNAAVRAATPLSGTTSALLTGTTGTIGNLAQTVDSITGNFTLTFKFAAVDPGTASSANRAMQLLVSSNNNSGQINLIVTRGTTANTGSIQLYNGTTFVPITSQADKVNFSSSLDTPVVNTLTLSGTVGGNYTVNTNGTLSGEVAHYQGGNPANFGVLTFTTVNAATQGFAVDDVTFVPEPASIGVAAIGAISLLARRARRSR